MKKILALPGSTRENSSIWKILNCISNMYSDQLDIEIYDEIDQLPHFNPNLTEDDLPTIIKSFLAKITIAEGIIVCTPEYVFSPPAVLKNALEWTVSETVFSYKPTALIVASGLGEKTLESLSLILKTLIQEEIPKSSELLIQGARNKINARGEISDEKTLTEIKGVVDSLISTIDAKK
jgi:NAD(P)H-dependent FMN reductase